MTVKKDRDMFFSLYEETCSDTLLSNLTAQQVTKLVNQTWNHPLTASLWEFNRHFLDRLSSSLPIQMNA